MGIKYEELRVFNASSFAFDRADGERVANKFNITLHELLEDLDAEPYDAEAMAFGKSERGWKRKANDLEIELTEEIERSKELGARFGRLLEAANELRSLAVSDDQDQLIAIDGIITEVSDGWKMLVSVGETQYTAR